MKFLLGEQLECDTDVLLETRLLVQGTSGAGKTHLLRRILEQTFGHVQQFIIDTEGEFYTLREKYDYVLVAKDGGEAAADPRIAPLLVRRLLELNASAIFDISELKPGERIRFVRYVAETLVDVPRKLWRDLLVVFDEAQIFCPQSGDAESMGAINDLMGRARKRGFCPILATLRPAMLHKNSAMLCHNKLIGMSMEIDAKRGADELGLAGRAGWQRLQTLDRGHFYAFGPAISRTVTEVLIGPTVTQNPERGDRIAVPPPAPERIKKLLPQLSDLPAEAEQERKDNAALRTDLAQARRELTVARKEAAPPDEAVIKRRVEAATTTLQRGYQEQLRAETRRAGTLERLLRDSVGALVKVADRMTAGLNGATPPSVPAPEMSTPVSTPPRYEPAPKPAPRMSSEMSQDGIEGLRSGAVRILRELARRYPLSLTKAQVGTLTSFAPRGGTFGTYIGELRRRGLITIEGKDFRVTEAGLDAAGEVPAAPVSHGEVMEMWQRNLRAGCYRMLEVVVEAGRDGITREDLAEQSEFTASGGTFGTYLGILRRNGLVEVWGDVVVPCDILWPEMVA